MTAALGLAVAAWVVVFSRETWRQIPAAIREEFVRGFTGHDRDPDHRGSSWR